ncbi:glycosyltransferase family 1 protein [Pedobacter sp. Du54]|uniref:glycosyltransferase family 4 protein n=1 Tax=Pedobacter anseongensis TaxID=3133439 RepID=UPI0030AAFCD2
MKVVFDCERMKYPYTGLFEYCQRLASNLISLKQKNDEIVLYLPEKAKLHFNAEVKIINQKSLHKFIFPTIDSNIDIWHTTHQTSWYVPPRKRHIKHVLTIHDLNFLHEEKSLSKCEKYLKKIQDNIDRSDCLVAISEFTKQDILKHLKVDIPISVIYNGCDLKTFPNFNSPNFRPTAPYLFSLGTVNPKKNFHVLPCLLQNNTYQLIIAGKADKNYADRIVQEAEKYGVADRVFIIGAITNEEKYWYYKNCEAFLFPSIAEGFGIPVIEAMSFGKPTFLSKSTSLPEIGGKNAYYFENFDSLTMVKNFNEGFAHYEGTNPSVAIINHAKQFNWQKCASEYLTLYKSLM